MVDMPEMWQCACGEWTDRTHWRHGADGAMFHAGPDAPPSDPAPRDDEQEVIPAPDGDGT